MADSSAKLPLDSPGARMYVGVPMSRRTSRCFVSTLSHWYWCRETSAAGSMKSSKRAVVETLSCLSAISFPSLPYTSMWPPLRSRLSGQRSGFFWSLGAAASIDSIRLSSRSSSFSIRSRSQLHPGCSVA